MDTPRYRIGNDLSIFWAINNRDGSPYDLDGKEVRLFMTHERGREEVEAQITRLEDGIRNNVIRWDFKAEDQRVLGKYTLTFVVLESDTHRELTKDYGEAFTLVGRSEMESGEGDANISIGGDLILSTKLDIYRIQATNVDVAGLKNQIYDVEKGLTTKVEKEEFNEKTGELEQAYVKVETTIKGITTEIKDASGEITQIKKSVDGIEVSVGDLEYKVESLEKQTDGAIEKWFYPGAPGPDVLPESNWKTEQEKYSHLGDIYYDEDSGIAYRYITKDGLYLWVVIEDADIIAALEAAKNSNRTFIDQPKTPYKVGDLWIAEKDYADAGIKQNDIVVCINAREEGQFDINDWQKKGNAINDEDLESFVDDYYNKTILPEIQQQLDQQATATYGPDDPSLEWEEGTEADHKGDLWYNTNVNKAFYWSGTKWVESEVPEEVFDKIDGKNTIYVTKPEGKDYKENDLWFVEKAYNEEGFKHQKGVILVALEDAVFNAEAQTYSFKYSDWARRDTYTDDTAVTNLNNYIIGGFKDGILDESEKQSIASAWDSIVLAQEQLTADYLTVILPGYGLPEFAELKKTYKAVYNEEATDEYPNLGAFQILEQKVAAILAYEVSEEASTLSTLIKEYDDAYDAYRLALSNYTTAYAELTNAIRGELGVANEYIEAIIDDGKLTPIEKKQLLEVYKSLAAEFNSNKDAAFTAKIWKLNDEGEEVAGAYSGEDDEYFDIYVAYKEAYAPILAVFTGTDWGFDKMDETTTFEGEVDLSTLRGYFNAYYVALEAMAHVIAVIAEEKAEASLAMKEYMDDLEGVLTPTEAITQIGKGVVLSSVIGVGTYDEASGKYLLKAGMNATSKDTNELVTMNEEHGRIVIVGGADADNDWNNAAYVVYEDGHVIQLSGKIGKDVQIGEAVIQSVIADQINLLSWPEYDEVTGQTKLTPLFAVNTEKDANGKDKIVSISALYDTYIGGNLVVRGDTSSTKQGSNAGVAGTLLGIVFNGTKYDEPVNGILTIPNTYYTTEQVDDLIAGVDVSDQLAGYQPLITASNKLAYNLISGVPTKLTQFENDLGLGSLAYKNSLGKADVGLGNVENKSSATIRGEITSANVTTALGYTPANNASLANYLPISGGTINGNTIAPLLLNANATGHSILQFSANDTYLGALGFSGVDSPYYRSSGGGQYAILHSGNIGDYAMIFYKATSSNYALPDKHNIVGYGHVSNGWHLTGPVFTFGLSNYYGLVQKPYNSNTLYVRSYVNGSFTDWQTIAFTDSNVASATKLQTPRTIWGQSFDGTGDVNGVLFIRNNSGIYAFDNGGSNSYLVADLGSDNILRFGYAKNETHIRGNSIKLLYGSSHTTGLTLNSSGNILIGTTADNGAKLYVDAASVRQALHLNTNATAGPIVIQSHNGVNKTWWGYSPTLKGAYFFGPSDSGVFVSDNGNVGIGTTSPSYKLDVLSDNFECLRLQRNQSNNLYGAAMVFGNTSGNYGAIGWNQIDDFFISNSSTSVSSNAIMRGSHTTLTIYPAVTMSSTLSVGGTISASTNNAYDIGSNSSMFRYAYVGWLGAKVNEKLILGANNGSHVYIGTNGYLGVNKSAPEYQLDVNGHSRISGNLIVTGDTSSGSDIRFKDKIADHIIALSDIADAPLFTFTWNDREDDSVHLGSSAQYWEKVAPWLVKGEDFKTLDYSTLGVAMGISLAKKAVNHEERIKILEEENKALKEEIRRIQYGS